LHFTVFEGSKPVSVRVPGFFEIGRDVVLLCTVSPRGHMKVFKDGVIVGENAQGTMPKAMDRPSMLLGGHFKFHDQKFCGAIRDAKVWNQEVSWPLTQQGLLAKLGNGFLKPGARLLLEVVEEPGPHAGHAVAQVYTQADGGLDGEGRWAYAGKMWLTISMDQDSKCNMSLNFAAADITGTESCSSTTTPATGTPYTSPRDSQN
jgi:hypothetical protein